VVISSPTPTFRHGWISAGLDPTRISTPTPKRCPDSGALVEPDPPPNFLWVYSYGGTQDAALNPAVDRVADVFPDESAIVEAG